MTLADVVRDLDAFPDEDTIWVEGDSGNWSPASAAVVAPEPDEGGPPPEASGLAYCLEVWLAKEAIAATAEAWGRELDDGERTRAVLHYAKYDAYLVDA